MLSFPMLGHIWNVCCGNVSPHVGTNINNQPASHQGVSKTSLTTQVNKINDIPSHRQHCRAKSITCKLCFLTTNDCPLEFMLCELSLMKRQRSRLLNIRILPFRTHSYVTDVSTVSNDNAVIDYTSEFRGSKPKLKHFKLHTLQWIQKFFIIKLTLGNKDNSMSV
jgi:hypothetical protein